MRCSATNEIELGEVFVMYIDLHTHTTASDGQYTPSELVTMAKEKNIEIFKELECHTYKVNEVIYNDKEFLIQDPDGYLLRFNN